MRFSGFDGCNTMSGIQTDYGVLRLSNNVGLIDCQCVFHLYAFRYVCILDTLDSLYAARREPELMGIRLCLTNHTTVATILLLTGILKPVNMLSLYLQEENINFTTLPEHVKNRTEELHGLVEKYRNLQTSDTEFTKCMMLFGEIQDRTNLERRVRECGRQ
ncbi:uncharacterized protein LOC123562328 [Mercenaria mercenaria]|uniref:uncharacterized protein LOC123562328 n=1 Tax=Mercenaria mercenaria TaxID=6596 RepID=UPI00234E56B2|nr:uncharacterized protein LOC123562328 [Mercenaria mercenaria]